MAIDGLRIPDGRNSLTWLLYGHDETVAKWVANQLKLPPYPQGMYRAIGIMRGNCIIGGVVWNNFHNDFMGKPLLIEVTLATIDKMWCSRHNLRELFAYPFIQLNVKRVQATCSKKSKHVRRTLERLGFKLEGIMRQGCPSGGDAAHYSILKHECKWLNHGKKRTFTSAGTRSGSNITSPDTIEPANSPL